MQKEIKPNSESLTGKTLPEENMGTATLKERLIEVALLFLRLGATSFGGPAAYISLMHHEVVVRRKWIDDQRFLDIIGAANLIPGPNATEIASAISVIIPGLHTRISCNHPLKKGQPP